MLEGSAAVMLSMCLNCHYYFSFVQLAFGAAILNIHIPLMLGDLVNIVARYLSDHAGDYVGEIRAPALRLLGLYGLQVS